MGRAAWGVTSAIGWYRRRLSARKGWSCAHRVAFGGPSCSRAVDAIVRERGLLRGLVPVGVRFLACAQAAGMLTQTDVRGVCCCGGIPIPFAFPLGRDRSRV